MSADPAKRLNGLLKRLKGEFGDVVAPPPATPQVAPELVSPSHAEPLVEELVFSFLLWESTTPNARAAHERLRSELVDYNELRVCLASELAEIVGPRDPRGDERAQRMRASLSELYRREHAITLAPLMTAGKREARQYLETLEGIPPFVVARTMVIALGGHAVPVDERLRDLLVGEGVLEAGTSVEAATAWLERQVRSADAGPTALLLQAWSDSQPIKRTPKVSARSEGRTDSSEDEDGLARVRNQSDDSIEASRAANKPVGPSDGKSEGKRGAKKSSERPSSNARATRPNKSGSKSSN